MSETGLMAAAPAQHFLPLTSEQRRLWRMTGPPSLSCFNLNLRLRLEGHLNTAALGEALRDVCKWHESLRSMVRLNGAEKQFEVQAEWRGPEFGLVRLRSEADSATLSRASDLTKEFPIQASLGLCRGICRADWHILTLTIHPLAFDAWSIRPMAKDLAGAYVARLQGAAPIRCTQPYDNGEFQRNEEDWLAQAERPTTAAHMDREHWRRALTGLPLRQRLSTRSERKRASIRLNPGLHRSLAALTEQAGTTLFPLLHCAISAMLAFHGCGSDIPFATLVSGRDANTARDSVGLFSSPLILRCEADLELSFPELLAKYSAAYHDALHYARFPVSELLCSGPLDDPRMPAQAMLLLRPTSECSCSFRLPDLCMTSLPMYPVAYAPELLIDLAHSNEGERAGGITGDIYFDPAAFAPPAMKLVIETLGGFLQDVIAGSKRSVRELLIQTLPAPQSANLQGSAAQAAGARCARAPYLQPQFPLQHQLIRIWESVLGLSGISIMDSFADLGGSEEEFARMLEWAQKECQLRLPSPPPFTETSVMRLAHELLCQLPPEPIFQIRRGNGASKTPFALLHGDVNGGGLYVNALAEGMGQERDIFGFHPHGLNGSPVLPSITTMAADFIRSLRTVRPHGPYALGGYCIGGLVAFEAARLLQCDGEELDALVLIHALYWDPPVQDQRPSTPCPALPCRLHPEARFRHGVWLLSHYLQAAAQYAPSYCDVKTTLLWPSQDLLPDVHPAELWRRQTAEVEFAFVPGDHLTCVSEHAAELGARIRAAVEPSH